jgi:NADPH:quinone reductase-like Zn-dependent oxidoreductase
MEKMKAVIYTKYGPPEVLQIQEVDQPVPKDNEVLVEVRAASLNAYDWRFLRGKPLVMRLMAGLRRPRNPIAGADLAGRVAAVGGKVQGFKPGDEVFGCQPGAFAEYASVRQDRLALKPGDLSFEDAAAMPMAGITALQALRDKGQIQPGLKVLIYGAGGGVGTFAVQIAKSFGASVSAVCGPTNADLVRSLGADHVIDYTQDDFTRTGERYDLILAVNGSRSIFTFRRSLSPCGIYVVAGGSFPQLLQGLLLGPVISRLGRKKMGSMLARINARDLDILSALQQSRRIKPIIDRRYPLSEIAAAVGYLEQGHARGKVVITVKPDAA